MVERKRNWRQDLKIFRERLGGLSDEKKAWAKQQRDIFKAIRQALRGSPATIPELAARTALREETVVWHVMALRRYGEIAECGQAGDYYLYQLKEAAS